MGQPLRGHTRRPPLGVEGTGGTETSQYPEEQKSHEIPLVVASERGGAQTAPAEWPASLCGWGVVRRVQRLLPRPRGVSNEQERRSVWEGAPQRVTAP